ncbi:MAG: hypothetical protein JKY56_09775, partial [Kofleriaceae bacterium]|nr:hypothetical protein [Kofleriaceae bacterium]
CIEGHEKFPYKLAEAIERDHDARKKLLAARAKYVDHFRSKGRCFLQCPHCLSGGIEIDLFMMFLVHGAMPHPVANPDQSPTDPFMAYLGFELDFWPLLRTHLFTKKAVAHTLVKTMEKVRDTLEILGANTPPTRDYRIPPAKSAQVSLPSRTADVFEERQVHLLLRGPVLPTHDLNAVLRWGDYSLGPTNENAFWNYTNPGFRTLLRLAMITSHPDGKTEFGPEILETWPVSDILFLDTLYAYLHSMSTTNPERGAVRCMGCGKEFLAAL